MRRGIIMMMLTSVMLMGCTNKVRPSGYLLALGGDSYVAKWVKLGYPKRVNDFDIMAHAKPVLPQDYNLWSANAYAIDSTERRYAFYSLWKNPHPEIAEVPRSRSRHSKDLQRLEYVRLDTLTGEVRYMNFNTMQNYDSTFHIDQMVSGNLFLTSRVLESSVIELRLYDADSQSVVKSWSFPLVDQDIAISEGLGVQYYETKQERLFFSGAEALTQVVVIDLKSGQRSVLPARTRNNFGISQKLIVFNHLLMLNEENERLLLNLETLEMQELPSYIKGEYLDNIYMLPNGYILVSYDKFVRSPLEGILAFNRDRWVVLHDPANNYISPKYYRISGNYLLYKEEKPSYIGMQ